MTTEIIHPSDRAAWLAVRRKDVTASVAAAVLGAHPYTTPYELWAEKTGRLSPDDDETDAMERGNLMEPVVVAMVRKRYPGWSVIYENDRAYYRDPDKRIGATPDAFLCRPDRLGTGNMQIKSASEEAFEKYWLDADTGDVIPPTWIAVQAITEAQLIGLPWAVVALVVLTRRGTLKLHIIDIPIHLKLWSRLVAAVGEFWAMIDIGQEPSPDWGRDGPTVLDVYRESMPDRRDLTNDVALDDLIGRYVEAREARLLSSKIEDAHRPRIIHAIGNAEAAYTTNWQITARTTVRPGDFGQPNKTRVLRVKPREEVHADRF